MESGNFLEDLKLDIMVLVCILCSSQLRSGNGSYGSVFEEIASFIPHLSRLFH